MKKHQVVLKDEELQLMMKLTKYGYVDFNYIDNFHYRTMKKTSKRNRIQRLVKMEYLSRYSMFIPDNFSTVSRHGYQVIGLGSEGKKIMKNMGYEIVPGVERLAENGSAYRVYHQVQLATAIESISSWLELENEFCIYQILSEKEMYYQDCHNQPDACVLLQRIGKEEAGLIALYIELERSYASPNNVYRKLLGYTLAFKDKEYESHFIENRHVVIPVVSNRVVFIAEQVAHYEALKKKISDAMGEIKSNTQILSTSIQTLFKEPGGLIYYYYKDEEMYRLLQRLP